MNIKIDIHKNHILDKKLKAVSSWKGPESVKKDVLKFIDKAKIGQVNEGRKLSDRTLSKYLTLLKHNLEIIKKPINSINKKDIESYDKKISSEGLASVVDYRRALRVFSNWKLGESKTKKLAGWLDTRDKNKTPDYFTEQEATKLYKNCKNSAERYLIAVLFDTGARAEEFLNIRYEDIQLPDGNNNFVKIALKEEYSKTKGRTISLYWKYSLEAIRDFIKEREQEGIRSDEQVFKKEYDPTRFFLYRLGEKVLKKKISPHLFRHSSATYYAPKLNRQELCYRYGWKFSSDMPDVYISRSGMESKELDEKFKSTELEDLQRQVEKEKFAREKMQEEFGKYAPLLKALQQKIEKNPKVFIIKS